MLAIVCSAAYQYSPGFGSGYGVSSAPKLLALRGNRGQMCKLSRLPRRLVQGSQKGAAPKAVCREHLLSSFPARDSADALIVTR